MRITLKKRINNAVVNVTTKVVLGVFVFAFLLVVVYIGIKPYRGQLREGDVSLRDIFAPFDFISQGDMDEEATQKLCKEAVDKIKAVYVFDSSKLVETEKKINDFFYNLKEARKSTEIFGDDERIKLLRSKTAVGISDASLSTFFETEDMGVVENLVIRMIYEINDHGILRDEDKTSLNRENIDTIAIYDTAAGTEEDINIDSLLSMDKAKSLVDVEVNDVFGKDKKLKKAATEFILLFLEPNLQFDSERTQKRKEEIVNKIPPLYKEVSVKKNEILLERGQRITKTHLKKLDKLNMVAMAGKFSYLVGLGIILAIFLTLAVSYLRLYEPRIFHSNKNLLLIAFHVIFLAAVSEVIVVSPTSSYLIPVASVSMLLTILIGTDVAFLVTMLMSIFCGVIAGDRFGVTIVSLVGGCVGIYSVRKVRRRSKLFLAGFWVGIANFLAMVGIGYLNSLTPRIILQEGVWGLANGFLSFFIVIGLLPLLESLFKITTDVTLLELSDLNHPVLKDLVIKAPGTYHHSLLVGNLAEAACDAVGANSLLARVGSYYHDIGKIGKAEYFSENETNADSRHDGLTPSMSALVITSHVKDGVELAHRHKLHRALVDFIEQHHGTSMIYYFYQKALEKGVDENQLNEEDFRYPGPKPQTKEAAIVLLADSVEASSRTLANPIPSRIKDLVQRIINNKFIDNQLDECELTLKDLNKISDSFVRTLSGVFHTRVEYPKEMDTANHKNKDASNRNKKSNGKEDSDSPNSEGGDKKDS